MEFSNINDPHRKISVSVIYHYLGHFGKSQWIERSIYNRTIQLSKHKRIHRRWDNKPFTYLYKDILRSVCANLNGDSYLHNVSLKQRVLDGTIDYKNLASLSGFDVFPETWKELFEKKEAQDKLKYEMKPESMTDEFKCRACGSRSCSYYEVQTRSADEPMTQFVNCLNPECGNRWKQ